jgi:uncharacterized membrane protein
MSALAVLLILVIVLIFILLVGINNKVAGHRQSLHDTKEAINNLARQVERLQQGLQKSEKGEEKPVVKKEIQEPAPEIPIYIPPFTTIKKQPPEEDEAIPVMDEQDERTYTEEKKDNPWIKKNPDLERFIGENLANKIGIAVLVLGISFFVKYAIDKNWINEAGRVIIGLICGSILIGLAHYIRNNYRSFSSVLVGGGLTVFYFTIAYAFHEYHLISQTAAFAIMVIISAFAVLLALYYNKQELAILATIGGFLTPFLVTTGQENHIALFTYLCILNAGLMVLAWFKRWPSINIIALFFTTIIYGGWLVKKTVLEDAETLPYRDAFLFASLFYILFVVMNIINNLRVKRKFGAFDFIIVLSINFLYYSAVLFILRYYNHNYKGVFTASLGVLNFLLVIIFQRKKNIDNNFVSLLTGLSLTFISLTAPVQLKGNHIVLFWAAESVILFWLYQRSKIIHLKVASLIVSTLMTACLIITWSQVYFSDNAILPVLMNKGFITTLVAASALFIYFLLLRKEKDEFYLKGIRYQPVKNAILTSSLIIAYLAGALEIYYQFSTRFTETQLYTIYIQAYSFGIAILLLQVFKRSVHFPILKFVFTALCLGLYLFHLKTNYTVSLDLLTSNTPVLFTGHWVAAIFLFWLLYSLIKFFFRNTGGDWSAYRTAFTWISAISIILLFSVELYHIILWTNYSNENDWTWWENLYYKAGLTILWGICSFSMMWLGMKFSFRELRIISLSLFTITLFKLFIYDIRNIPPGGKIAAFILLGVMLLTVSFMYQRLKKIIIDNEAKETDRTDS